MSTEIVITTLISLLMVCCLFIFYLTRPWRHKNEIILDKRLWELEEGSPDKLVFRIRPDKKLHKAQ